MYIDKAYLKQLVTVQSIPLNTDAFDAFSTFIESCNALYTDWTSQSPATKRQLNETLSAKLNINNDTLIQFATTILFLKKTDTLFDSVEPDFENINKTGGEPTYLSRQDIMKAYFDKLSTLMKDALIAYYPFDDTAQVKKIESDLASIQKPFYAVHSHDLMNASETVFYTLPNQHAFPVLKLIFAFAAIESGLRAAKSSYYPGSFFNLSSWMKGIISVPLLSIERTLTGVDINKIFPKEEVTELCANALLLAYFMSSHDKDLNEIILKQMKQAKIKSSIDTVMRETVLPAKTLHDDFAGEQTPSETVEDLPGYVANWF